MRDRDEKGVEWTKDATIDKKHQFCWRSVQSDRCFFFYFFALLSIFTFTPWYFTTHIQISTCIGASFLLYNCIHTPISLLFRLLFSLSLFTRFLFLSHFICVFFIFFIFSWSQTEININHSLFIRIWIFRFYVHCLVISPSCVRHSVDVENFNLSLVQCTTLCDCIRHDLKCYTHWPCSFNGYAVLFGRDRGMSSHLSVQITLDKCNVFLVE